MMDTSPQKASLNIVADENIPGLEAWFADLGVITRAPGRTLTKSQLAEADVLLVRSVTQVDAALLEGTPVRFVGSCTIGTDHLDTGWLESRGIHWSAAPGCNANSVVEYVFCALAALDVDWRERSFGIVGCGNVGGLLQQRLKALGIPCKIYDPWLPDNPDAAELDAVLQQDVICLHAPLVKDGPHPSLHMIDADALRRIKPGAVLISAGRGAVIENQALFDRFSEAQSGAHLVDERPFTAVLDVWENEPDIRLDLLQKVNLGSPHIAGYSHDGKLAGTSMIRQALNKALELPPLSEVKAEDLARQPLATGESGFAAIRALLLQMYDPREDDRRLREAGSAALAGGTPMAEAFDRLRKQYPKRLEFSHYRLEAPNLDAETRQQLEILGLT
ncbi:4-phosphoerythronate dehydrogenase [Microbulbifer sp. CAU 1566]|uniref:4-phosphoerythronate dehydrogenase n=1 Tax=Microbulbifer sp. CAU 1566 TaxID=2933269 RepID=UPI0020056630|nr:4-phosphoerythronate dehydrogenase [Microbulbifer sp. CAU 1566]MCK7597233.1 4-phosphoerythronate dehydrogenase [Microbulbifer sp. CAU 1566]